MRLPILLPILVILGLAGPAAAMPPPVHPARAMAPGIEPAHASSRSVMRSLACADAAQAHRSKKKKKAFCHHKAQRG